MKIVKLAGLIIAIVALSPLLALLLLLICIGKLIIKVQAVVALITINKCHRELLIELHSIGSPRFVILYETDFVPYHDHKKCTYRTCEYKQADEHWRLIKKCQAEHVPEWRIRWAA
ncbi:hypothetical protein A3H66_02135 [Candidatus Falkowbacteria bacterium RIFCSPLOWO2_02_FULL_45_21]|uniref:Uncharacterized protein n=1 Tax=Candidatus Falkowbacteria bacterium RIFCSPLOWO2_02_FULL_45_21 TaxID=1797989 RepID=A0A1F5SAK0_9BACT|nr:MAG: hypothetical protein A3H66_02135 [Candidatus Falkowbacteria bacterium RIFCSPLOWO2_02_FULL_45_21]